MNPHRERRPGELVFSALLLAGSLFMLWQAFGISKFESITSAGVFPMVATATMVVTAALVLWRTAQARPQASVDGLGPARRFARQITPPVLLGFSAAIAVYMAALDRLGFLPASSIFLLVSMRLLGSRRWGLNLLVGALSLAAVYVVFQTAFSVVLPKGTLWQGLRGWLP